MIHENDTDVDLITLNTTQHQDNECNLSVILAECLEKVEEIIYREFQHKKLPILESVSHHIIASGGKRIRPLLCLAVAHLLSNSVNSSIFMTAAAIEFIHTATLLHDDVIDNGDARRGKKTAHLIWGNQISILVGDHMFARAFFMLAETNNLSVIKTISEASKKLAEGEIIQLSLKQKILDFDSYIDILSNKTATLFASGCAAGAILAQSDSEMIQNAYDFGFNFGISFQLIDDILDYQGNENLGKNIGTDFFEGKFTLPLILAYHLASDQDKELIENLMLKKQERTQDDFVYITQIIQRLDTISKAYYIAQDYLTKAEICLDKFGHKNSLYNGLKNMISKALNRKI